MNGDWNNIYEYGTGAGNNTFFNQGSYNKIQATLNQDTIYNYRPYVYSNALGNWQHVFNYASFQYTYSSNSTNTVTGGIYSGVVLDYSAGYFGFAGKKDAASNFFSSSISDKLDPIIYTTINDGPIASSAYDFSKWQVSVALEGNVPVMVNGRKWEHTEISWAIGEKKDGFEGKFDQAELLVIEKAFQSWADVSGLKSVSYTHLTLPTKA